MKQYQTDKAEREIDSIAGMEAVNAIELARVAEPEFRYGAEAFEAHQKGEKDEMTNDKVTKNKSIKS